MLIRILLLTLLLTVNHSSLAQQFRVEALSEVDRKYMQDQRDNIDQLARRHLGRQFNGEKRNDLDILQKILDQQLIRPEQTQLLQAMGVILGDALKKEEKLSWIIYIDRYGRSRALAIPTQDEVIFPITMISRRAEVGNRVDVSTLYATAQAAVAEIRKIIIVR